LSDWKGVRQALVRTAVDILEAKPAVKFEKMKEIRDRFVLSFNSIDLKLQKSSVVSQNIKEVFKTSQKAWISALEALQDIRRSKTTSKGRTAAALFLAASINSKDNPGWNTKPTYDFQKALAQWRLPPESELRQFIDLCWPSPVKFRNESRLPRFRSEGSGILGEHIVLLNAIFGSAESCSDFQATRNILTNFMEEDNIQISADEISTEVMAATLTISESSIDELASGIPSMEIGELNYTNELKITSCPDWVGGAVILGMIVKFLFGKLHTVGLTSAQF
jgi:hypothetical protein